MCHARGERKIDGEREKEKKREAFVISCTLARQLLWRADSFFFLTRFNVRRAHARTALRTVLRKGFLFRSLSRAVE